MPPGTIPSRCGRRRTSGTTLLSTATRWRWGARGPRRRSRSFFRRVGRRGEEIRDDERGAQAPEGGRRAAGRRGEGVLQGCRGPRLRDAEGRDEADRKSVG